MSRVVIVGGGLSGLAAAALLEQHNIDYSLIEVKRRLGGSLISQRVDDFIFDGVGFVSDIELLNHPLIAEWGLQSLLTQKGFNAVFRQGTQSLIDALSARINGPRLMRMALSSIGELEGGSMALCMENGLMLNARAIILALPARYAERIFYGYHSEITEHLLSYRYDHILRLSLGYRTEIPHLTLAGTTEFSFLTAIRLPERGGSIVQVGIKTSKTSLSDDEVHQICIDQEWPIPHAISTHHWSEADPLTLYTPEYAAWREALMTMLPPRVALIGSDYVPKPSTHGNTPLSQCLTQAQEAVNTILAQL